MIGPLKITTDYTLLQSLIKIPDLISFLLTQNIKVCGICDDNLGGSLEFYTACKLNNIKPVIGLHVEIDENSLYLYAKNYLGYQELIKINTCKEEETLDYNVLNNCHNIIVILPYASRKLASALKDEVYFGFTSELEKKELLKFTKQIVYVEDIRTLKEKEIPYTKYLDYLRNDEKNIKYNCYQNIDDPGVLEEVIVKLNVEIPKIYNEIAQVINEEENDISLKDNNKRKENYYVSTPTLNQFGEDITLKAEEGKFDNLIGRENEIDRIIQILSRRTKNNPCLIGEPGVGKTAIVEGLAERIVSGEVPDIIKDKRIFSIDISGMVAGAKYRGDFEERIKKALNEVKKAQDIILFIDEVHTIVGAGAAEGAIDASNILKPLLARGEIQLIGATTIEEYRQYIEKDSALERRLSPVNIDEPSEQETIEILKGIRDKYEAHHNVKITDEAIKTAVNMSSRYVTDRFLPDKAIDLIDEASSQVKIKLYNEPDEIKNLQEKLEVIEKEKEEAIYNQEFEKAAEIRDTEKRIKKDLDENLNLWKKKKNEDIIKITEENIAEVISKWTGIPLQKLTQDDNEKLKQLEEKLHERVIGQDEAVVSVAKAIRRGRAGLKDPKRPIGSFLFLGPTGVGKTELSKAISEILFDNEKALIRIDMSEYMEPHSISKLIGSPPGYIGYDNSGQLTEKIRRKPYSVILFDEIEKAHPDVMNILLQLLEDGHLTDSHGREVDFKNTVIIMTSNLGARHITDQKSLGFINNKENNEYEETKKEVMKELKKELRPEFVNRIDEIIVFHKLNHNDMEKVTQIMLRKVEERLKEQNFLIEIDPSVAEKIVSISTDTTFGARPLRRKIQNLVENKISEDILDGKLIKGKRTIITAEDLKV